MSSSVTQHLCIKNPCCRITVPTVSNILIILPKYKSTKKPVPQTMTSEAPPPTPFLKGKNNYVTTGKGFLSIKPHLTRMTIAGRDVFIERNITQS